MFMFILFITRQSPFFRERMNQRRETVTGKQLIQGCYAVARVGVEPIAFELQGRTLSTEQRRTLHCIANNFFNGLIIIIIIIKNICIAQISRNSKCAMAS